MTATSAAVAVLGAGVGLGLWLAVAGLRGRLVLGEMELGATAERLASGGTLVRATAAGTAALAAVAATGWLAAGVLAAGSVVFVPRLLRGGTTRRASIARTEAIAAWAELVRDSIAAASGLEEAIVGTLEAAPEPIRVEVGLLVNRLRRQGLPRALAAFAADLDHPSGDLLATSLSTAAQTDAGDLTDVLTRIAKSIRGEASMRRKIDVGRAKLRTAVRIIVAVTALGVVMVGVGFRESLNAYAAPDGQIALAADVAWAGFGGWLFVRMARLELPERFKARAHRGATA